ncbi:N-acetylmuramoyl-L-alanine amidase [Prolixibacter bellariivorans]|uniref:N-acetylmuramoyl-L-alanine amidase n=1 Tax=Prolixibacter bellariivorans TaxID=314319 RepID=A0A5M4B1N7_9BACT|nr:N-acetylmuramoyl-L-alanine amidase [Prolixibacter bellariivorans]GET34090.1 N-acetylmuramoyl-L-alanine amidase [Prolixibacter bellariivorans]
MYIINLFHFRKALRPLRTISLLLGMVILFSGPVYSQSENEPAYKLKTVVLDAGHGGRDPGAMVGKLMEKDIALDIVLKLGHYIKEYLPDVKVVYTRDSDFFVPLYKRAEIANKIKADLFISVHVNICGSPSIHGTETYALGLHRTEDNLDVAKKENSVILLEKDHTTRYEGFDPNSSESYIMFELVQNEFLDQSLMFASDVQNQFRTRAARHDRGVRQAGFLVLRETSMPSVLIETGYMSNKKELNYLESDNGRALIASAIFRAFRNYKKTIEARSKYHTQVAETPKKKLKPAIDSVAVSGRDTIDLYKGLVFAIQIAASKRELKPKSSNFKGVNDLYRIKTNNIYRYLTCASNKEDEVQNQLKEVQKKFPDAYVVAYENGHPVSIQKARKKIAAEH